MSSFEWMELQTLISDIETARARLADARQRKDHGRIRSLEDEIAKAERLRVQLLAHISTNIVSGEPAPVPRSKAGSAAAAAEPAAEKAEAKRTAAAPPEPAETAPVPEPEVSAAGDAAADLALQSEPVELNELAPIPNPADSAPPDQPAAHSATPLPTEVNGRESIPEPADRIVARGPAPPATVPKAGSAEGGVIVWDQLTPDHIERAKRELAARRADILARHAEELKALEAEQTQLDTLEQAIQAFLQKFSKPADEAAVVALDQERGVRQQG